MIKPSSTDALAVLLPVPKPALDFHASVGIMRAISAARRFTRIDQEASKGNFDDIAFLGESRAMKVN